MKIINNFTINFTASEVEEIKTFLRTKIVEEINQCVICSNHELRVTTQFCTYSFKLSSVFPPQPQPAQTHVMLDIETFGTSPGSVIKAIGAVKFDGQKVYAKFHKHIDTESSMKAGLTLDGPTVQWWLTQSDEARNGMCLLGEPLAKVLEELTVWISTPDAIVWGNGATFDNTLVAAAYKAVDQPLPWSYKNSQCYRTVKNANRDLPIDAFRVGTHHSALDDAESQALHLMAIWNRDAKRAKALELLKHMKGGFGFLLALVENKMPSSALEEWKDCNRQMLELFLD